MILRPQPRDFRIIGFYLSKLVLGIALFMVIPMILAFFLREFNPLFDFAISFLGCAILGVALYIFTYTSEDPKWLHGMIIVSFAWIVASLLSAVPLFLSGHFKCYLDAVFEATSGLTTTGLSLAQDLGHMSYSHNLWRHLLMFLGGQGIVVVVLTFFVRGAAGAFRLYVGEARDEQLLPDIRQTSRFIWMVSIVYLVLGTLALTIVGLAQGLSFFKALFHGACIFMTGFDTGGFTPQQQNIMYYHSLPFEITTLFIMILGAMNFKLHYSVWTGQRREIVRNLEISALFISLMVTFSLVAWGLSRNNLYPGVPAIFRKGFYQLVSAHTGTGFSNVYTGEFIPGWGNLAVMGIIVAMGLGGSICSTTGAIKMLRVGIIAKAFSVDVRRYISPESAVFVEKIHHIKNIVLTEKHMQSAFLVTIAYAAVYFAGAVIGVFFGYPFLESLFESTSATGNVGLSCGITGAAMPTALKVTYIFQMWAGRLEFVSVFVLIGFILAVIKGK